MTRLIVSPTWTGQADRAALVGDGAGDGLANPPGGVGAELEAALVVELVGGLHQADVAFLDQIQEGQAATDVLLGDGDDEAEIGLDQVGARQVAVELVGFEAGVIVGCGRSPSCRRSSASLPRSMRLASQTSSCMVSRSVSPISCR